MTDRYTKVILTVIAVCLIIIAVRDRTVVTPAQAQSPVHVIIDGVAQTPSFLHRCPCGYCPGVILG
jgi:hypothetical protein